MIYDLWVNLPVKDLGRTREFFEKLGFAATESPTMVNVKFGKNNVAVNFIREDVFKDFAENGLATPSETEKLLSLGVESRDEVDELAGKVEAAGGNVFSKPGEIQGWMYGCTFADPDGHRWNALYMDMSKMGKA